MNDRNRNNRNERGSGGSSGGSRGSGGSSRGLLKTSIPIMTIVMAVIYLGIFLVIFMFLNQIFGEPLALFAWIWGFQQEWVLFGMLGISVILVFIIFVIVKNATRKR